MIPKTGASTRALLAGVVGGLLGGCTQIAPNVLRSHLPIYSTDLQGKAALCTASSVQPEPGKTVTATITTGGGGWCALTVANDGKPYAAGLVERRPEHGRVYIHSVGDETRVDYTPDAAAVTDRFAVQLIPGDATVTVTVQPASATPSPASKGPAK